MVEAAAHNGNLCAETGLDLVGDGQSQQEICSARFGVFGDGENGTEVVGRVTQTAGSQIGVE